MNKNSIKRYIIGTLIISLFACTLGMVNNPFVSSAASKKMISGYYNTGKKIKVSFKTGKVSVGGWYTTQKSVFDNPSKNKKHKQKTYSVSSSCPVTLLEYNTSKKKGKEQKMSYKQFVKVQSNYSYTSTTIRVSGSKVSSITMNKR